MKITTLLACLLALVGCVSPSHSSLKEDEIQTTVSAATDYIINSGLVTETELQKYKTDDLEISYYFLAKPYADYRIAWAINEKEEILIVGRGDILKLEGSTINRRQK